MRRRLQARSDYSLPSTRSTTQHPRTCVPRARQCVEDVLVVAPGVLKGVGQDRHRGEVARLVHLPGEGNAVSVRHAGAKVTGRKGLPKISRIRFALGMSAGSGMLYRANDLMWSSHSWLFKKSGTVMLVARLADWATKLA